MLPVDRANRVGRDRDVLRASRRTEAKGSFAGSSFAGFLSGKAGGNLNSRNVPHIGFDRFCHAKGTERETGGHEMDQAGMWKLFFATGLPEAYLAARSEGERQEAVLPPMPPPGLPGSVGMPPPGWSSEKKTETSAGPL